MGLLNEQRSGRTRPVAVVSGGGGGIGAAISMDLGKMGAVVVVVDPGIGGAGTTEGESPASVVARQIEAAGGTAMASSISVTDAEAVNSLFSEVVATYGSLDILVNPAGFGRITDLDSGDEDDWLAVVDVHLNGYLNVLNAALPYMVDAGYGRIVGFTSGAGWRASSTGAYGCAKRAVASLTWALGKVLPEGITLNALSPIAATEPVLAAAAAMAGKTGALDLSQLPPPEAMAPMARYLASEESGWCSGQVVFSCGTEVAAIAPPHPLEAMATSELIDVDAQLDMFLSTIMTPVEAQQRTTGGSNRRLSVPTDSTPRDPTTPRGTCVIVCDNAEFSEHLDHAVSSRRMKILQVSADAGNADPTNPSLFSAASESLAQAAKEDGPVDAVIVALQGGQEMAGGDTPTWQQVLQSHEDIVDRILAQVAWLRAAADLSSQSKHPIRIVQLCPGATPGQQSAAQAVAQLSRASTNFPNIGAYAILVESSSPTDSLSAAYLAAYLASAIDPSGLEGAELVTGSDFVSLNAHPYCLATLTLGGDVPPSWLTSSLQRVMG